jgi:hypothetical protein
MKVCLKLNICSSDWLYLVKHHKGLLEVEYLFLRLTVPCHTSWRFAWSWISVHPTDCTLLNIIKVCLKLNICSSDWLYLVKHHKGLLEVEYLFVRLTVPCQTSCRFAWIWISVRPTDCTLSNIMKVCLKLNICSSDSFTEYLSPRIKQNSFFLFACRHPHNLNWLASPLVQAREFDMSSNHWRGSWKWKILGLMSSITHELKYWRGE